MADVDSNLKDWSTTASSNKPAGTATIGTGLDDNLREIEKVVRQDLAHKGADIASATTTDIGAVAGLMHDITGTTTITGLGTVSAGIWKILQFDGALTLTHNATSLILPGGANVTTAAGDVGIFFSEGSGNWRCVSYMPSGGTPFFTDTFTPTLSFGGGSTGMTFSTQVGKYTKIGNIVHWFVNIALSAKGSSTGSALIGGLPFTAVNTTGVNVPASIWATAMNTGANNGFMGLVLLNTTTFAPYKYASGTASQLTEGDFEATSGMVIQGTYFV